MKTCPVCKALTFDDAQICYGCLHRFSEGDSLVQDLPQNSETIPPSFTIRFSPQFNSKGELEWNCAVEAPGN